MKETLEEATENYCSGNHAINEDRASWQDIEFAFKDGAKWQQEQDKNKHSEENIAIAFNEGQAYSVTGKLIDGKEWAKTHKKEWFEQFKKTEE